MNEAEKLLKRANEFAEFTQVNINTVKQDSINLKNNTIDSFDSSNSKIYSVKVWRNNKYGFSFSNRFSRDIVDRAIKIAKANKKEEYFYGLPEKKRYPNPNIFDRQIEKLLPADFVGLSKQLIKDVNQESVILSQGGISSVVSEDEIYNSNGIEARQKYSKFMVYAASNIMKNGKASSVWDAKEKIDFFGIHDFGIALRKKTLSFLDATKPKKIPKNIIITPEPLSLLLNYAFLENLNGKNVEKNKSILCGKVHEKVCSSNFSLIDVGKMNKGVNSKVFDSEGCPKQDTNLIKHGVLKNYVYDYNTALHAKKKPTGNAGESKIEFNNLVIKGDENLVDDAIIVESIIGAHTSNPITTDFSVGVERAYIKTKKGILPVKGCIFSGKFIEILNDVVSIGKKIEERNSVYSGPLTTTKGRII